MDIKLIIAAVTATLAVLGFYLQYLKRGKLACPRPSNALVGPLQGYGMAVTVPLSLRNTSARPIALERFSVQVVLRTKDTNPLFQAGLQWYLCEKLEMGSAFQLGTTITVAPKSQREVVVAFTNVYGWQFSSGHSIVTVFAHVEGKRKELNLCSFDIHLNDSEVAKLVSGQSISFYQRWHGKSPDANVLIPHDRTKVASV